MAKKQIDDFDDDEEENIDEEEDLEADEEDEPLPERKKVYQQPQRQPLRVENTNKFNQPQPKPKMEDRYTVVSQPAVEGIFDNKENRVIPLGEAIAMMLSKQERIEENLG